MILQFTLFVFLLFVVFRAVNYIYKELDFRQKYLRFIQLLLPVAELAIYLISIAWFLNYTEGYSTGYKIYIIASAIILMALITWFVLKDFVAGLVFKAKTGVTKGNLIKIDDNTYKISALGLLQLNVETIAGETVLYAYSKLSHSKISSYKLPKNSTKQLLSISLPLKNTVTDLKNKLLQSLINCPYVLSKNLPEIISERIANEYVDFDISIYVYEKEHVELVRNYVLKSFN